MSAWHGPSSGGGLGRVAIVLGLACAQAGDPVPGSADEPQVAPGGERARVLAWDPIYMPRDADRPATEATCALAAPWEQVGHWALRAPETIRSDRGLLYRDWEHSQRTPILKVLGTPRWQPTAGGAGLSFECTLERGVAFAIRIEPEGPDLRIDARLENRSPVDLANLETQFCLVHNGVEGFEDPRAERTFVRMGDAFVALGSTAPGLGEDATADTLPAYITATLPGEERAPPAAERSWLTAEHATLPLIATVSEDGERWVAIAFDQVFKLMTNCGIPCIHADPRFPDCPSGESVSLAGRVYFGTGPLEDVLPRFHADFPDWKPERDG